MFWHRLLLFTLTAAGHQIPLDSLTTTSTIRDELLSSKIIPQVLDDFEPTYYIDLAYPAHHSQVLLGNVLSVHDVSTRPVFSFHALTPPNDDAPNEKNLTFTLILTDPDALSYTHPTKSEMCHWIVTNLTTPLGLENAAEPLPLTHDVFDEGIAMLENLFVRDEKELQDGNENENETDDEGEDSTGHHTDKKKHKKHHKKKKNKHHEPAKLANEIEAYLPPGPPKKTGFHRYVFVLLEGDASHLTAPNERVHWGYGKERHGVRDWSRENNLTVVGVNFFLARNDKGKKKKHH